VRVSRFLLLSGLLGGASVVALLPAGCNSNTGVAVWSDIPDTVTLYSASRAQYTGKPSGMDFTAPAPVVVESATEAQSFDVVVAEQNGAFVLVPSGYVLGQANRAGIATTAFTELSALRQAPTDTAAYTQFAPVPVQLGIVYVVRSRRTSCLLTSGSYYAKIQVLSEDAVLGTLRLAYVQDPYCGNQSLVPPGS
jgi:hypothetical protein